MSNVGKWDAWYENLPGESGAFRYGDTITYELGAKFLEGCDIVEDWGTGSGGFLRYLPRAIGVDGSDTDYAQKKYVDLENYTSACDGIFMRHVLEHNYNWKAIISNALQSAKERICLVLFTELVESVTVQIAHNKCYGVDVPDLCLSRTDLYDAFDRWGWSASEQKFETDTGYGIEYVIYLTRYSKRVM